MTSALACFFVLFFIPGSFLHTSSVARQPLCWTAGGQAVGAISTPIVGFLMRQDSCGSLGKLSELSI